MSDHPFDRYADFTDLTLLKEYSERPLRKCLRVNTLKMSVEDFTKYAQEKGWELKQVPWCSEGFFVDRPLDPSTSLRARGDTVREPLGKDLLHMLGHTYIQEASSMLPVALLDPKPGEAVLDMAAAPGSKSTQIAAQMGNTGTLIANDMQEARLRTLVTALNRLGVTNVRVTKKVGQWFAKNMTARFDRVLIDAPCTGQGTSRKDPTALTYCSPHSIGKNAKLQRELLEAAIHAVKIGGRIVYSTCTLTPEENEDVVISVLKKFEGQVEVVDPRTLKMVNGKWQMDKAIEDSIRVQASLQQNHQSPINNYPFLRLWPQTYDSEGFFCAVLTKTGPTRDIEKVEALKLREEWMPKARKREITEFLQERFHAELVTDNDVLLENGERIRITNEKTMKFPLPCPHVIIGLPFGKLLQKSPIKLDHDFVTLRGSQAKDGIVDLTEEQWRELIRGQDCAYEGQLEGHILLRYNGLCIGRGRVSEGKIRNHLPRWMIQLRSS